MSSVRRRRASRGSLFGRGSSARRISGRATPTWWWTPSSIFRRSWRAELSERSRFARSLFAGIAPQYERMASVLSLGQDARVRRFMVSSVGAIPGSFVLDVASGTGLVSRELAAHRNVRVVSLDQSPEMLRAGVAVNRAAGLT